MPWKTAHPDKYIAALEKSGEAEVRAAIARGDPWVSGMYRESAEQWLQAKADSRSEAREDESLRIARQAARWSMWATVIALLAVIISARELVGELVHFVFGKG
ncbi:hypothetical protein [Hylemonella gracilis]|uniref:hypothetical protein n=1 Tax=Hylemonella gracilis TaxID=80880 RepID=UPI001E400860|nr:hypothetical protein [Hylemonella gracilis]